MKYLKYLLLLVLFPTMVLAKVNSLEVVSVEMEEKSDDVSNLLIKNKSTKEIANELGISEKTVRNHISNTMQKLGVKGRAGAVIELIKLKEISL